MHMNGRGSMEMVADACYEKAKGDNEQLCWTDWLTVSVCVYGGRGILH